MKNEHLPVGAGLHIELDAMPRGDSGGKGGAAVLDDAVAVQPAMCVGMYLQKRHPPAFGRRRDQRIKRA